MKSGSGLSGNGENKLQDILRSMVAGIESSKSQLFDVYEAARREVEEIRTQLDNVREVTRSVIDEVDALTTEEQAEKQKLVHVSADYSEDAIRAAYEAVKNVQVRLGVAKERERQLRRTRSRLETRLSHLQKTLQGAERLAMRTDRGLSRLYL